MSFRHSSVIVLATFAFTLAAPPSVPAQGSIDSVTVLFRAYGSSGTVHYVPGEFNGWVPNTAVSQMSYDAQLGAWTRPYRFKIHNASDVSRTLGDSVYQYKFNAGGGSGGWFSDPLNPERNPADNFNSVLRLTRLFWFDYWPSVASGQLTRFSVGLVHSDADSIVSITLSTGSTASSPLTTVDITSSYLDDRVTVDHTLSGSIGEGSYVRLVARTAAGDSVVFARGGYSVVVMPMPAGLMQGVNLPGTVQQDSVGFRLTAPTVPLVLLRIAPSGQPVSAAQPLVLRKHITSDDWWTFVKLAPGTYEYTYEVEDGRQIDDPFARVNGVYGSKFTVGSEGLSADDYAWQSTGYVRPPLDRAVIYELHVGEFAGGFTGKAAGQSTFDDLRLTLPYLDSLGVNAVELMPVTDYGQLGPSGFSWGYDVSAFMALEPAYGTPRQFKQFIDAAHARGIAVILDVVFNHQTDASALWQMIPDAARNVYFKAPGGAYNEDGLVFFRDVDHWSAETQELVYRTLKMWLDVYHVDGFRYDYTQGIGWDVNEPSKGILGWANRIDQEYGGSVYQIAEHLPESPALLFYSGITSGWHDSFHDSMFDEARFGSVALSVIEDLVLDLGAFTGNDTPSLPNRYADRTGPVNYTISHDELSLIYEMTTWQGVSVADAVLRDKLYAVPMFTSLGIPMLWEGQEFSEPRGWPNDGVKLSYRPVQWTWLGQQRGADHHDYYRTLIRQRRANPALYAGVLHRIQRYETGQKVLLWGLRDSVSGAAVMVAANFGTSEQTIRNAPWLATGTWYDIFDQSVLPVSAETLDSLVLPRYTARVFSNRSDEELGLVTGVRELRAVAPSEFSLVQNYPNPFNPSTTVQFTLPERAHVTLKVYSMLGTEVTTLAGEELGAGLHRVVWNGNDSGGRAVSSGTYLVRLQAAGRTMSRKILLLR